MYCLIYFLGVLFSFIVTLPIARKELEDTFEYLRPKVIISLGIALLWPVVLLIFPIWLLLLPFRPLILKYIENKRKSFL